MANTITLLLTPEERQVLYEPPVLNDAERNEYFTFSESEVTVLNSFKQIDASIYFAISLAFFKLKYTLINFHYQDVTLERQHIMQRYFPRKNSPASFLMSKDMIAHIENKVLAIIGFARFRGDVAEKMVSLLQKQASFYPRQRQLCKAFLNQLVKEKVAIPAITRVQDCITTVWNNELSRITNAYARYTSKQQRQDVLSLLTKIDDKHRIISIKKDMKQFTTTDIITELEKHEALKKIFLIAKEVLPKLQLPQATINYYAELINYYNGARLKKLNTDTTQLYLVCYSFSRFQIINDHLLEAFKKRTLTYSSNTKKMADQESVKYINDITAIRQKLHDLLITIKNDENKKNMPKSKLFNCIPEAELEITARALLNDHLDKKLLYWKYIDQSAGSIILNLRPLFLRLDITILRDDRLKKVVAYMKENLGSHPIVTLPDYMIEWIPKNIMPYMMTDEKVNAIRVEFLLYEQLAHHIETNKLILEFSVKHRDVDDNFMTLPKWKKEKKQLLGALPYSNLKQLPNTLLDGKEHHLKQLYQKVNANIINDKNPDILLKTNKQGEAVWHLRPLKKSTDPNEGIFAHFPKRGIVDVINFVGEKTRFLSVFESILPRATKQNHDESLLPAVILANALRMGVHGMANVCDLNLSSLITTENAYVRMETITQAVHLLNIETSKLPIFKEYIINGERHGSSDGAKIVSRIANILARHSPKFFGQDAGVSTYNVIFNYLSLAGRLIGANEYEANFTFEMAHHQNTRDFNLDYLSTDKHGMNSLNFALFDLTDQVFAPRIPKPHNQTLWGFGQQRDYDGLIITPDKILNRNYIVSEWDNMQRMVVS